MKKLSLTDILKTRTKVKVIGLLLVFLLATLCWQFVISKNPKKSSAATTISSSKIVGSSKEYDGQDLIISGASTVVVLDGEHNFSSLTIENGATLTHTTVSPEGKISYKDKFAVRWTGYIKVPINTDLRIDTHSDAYNDFQFGIKEVGNSAYLKSTPGWTKEAYSTGHLGNATVKIYQIEIDYKHLFQMKKYYSEGIKLSYHDNANGTVRLVEASMLCQDASCSQTGGLAGEYYAFTTLALQNSANPIVDSNEPFSKYGWLVKTRTDAQVNFDWSAIAPLVFEEEGGLKLMVTNAFNLDSGGKIDVSGKGYAGGDFNDLNSNNNSPAYGPGAGQGLYLNPTQQKPGDGSGAGYGGAGSLGDRDRDNNPVGGTYPNPFDQYTTYLDYGSGGGGGYDGGPTNESKGSGGNGGGLVYIKASAIRILSNQSSITADGQRSNIHLWEDDNCASGGGGSGGTIWLASNNISFPAGGSPFNIFGAFGAKDGRAEVGSLSIFAQISSDIVNLSVAGGRPADRNGNFCTGGQCGGGGGGGRIILGIYNNYSVQKSLSPISRTGVSPATNFNPYTLQKGDKIGVTLKIGGSATNLIIDDNWLATSNLTPNYICEPVSDSGPLDPLAWNTNPLIWKSISGGSEIYYECIVK